MKNRTSQRSKECRWACKVTVLLWLNSQKFVKLHKYDLPVLVNQTNKLQVAQDFFILRNLPINYKNFNIFLEKVVDI